MEFDSVNCEETERLCAREPRLPMVTVRSELQSSSDLIWDKRGGTRRVMGMWDLYN